MARRRLAAEQIVTKLLEIDVLQGQSKTKSQEKRPLSTGGSPCNNLKYRAGHLHFTQIDIEIGKIMQDSWRNMVGAGLNEKKQSR